MTVEEAARDINCRVFVNGVFQWQNTAVLARVWMLCLVEFTAFSVAVLSGSQTVLSVAVMLYRLLWWWWSR